MKSSQVDGNYIEFLRYVSSVSRIVQDSPTQLDNPAYPSPVGCRKGGSKCIEQRFVKFV